MGCCSDTVTIVLLAIFDAISTALLFGIYSVVFLFKSFVLFFAGDDDALDEDRFDATYYVALSLLIIYLFLDIVLITAAAIKNKLCGWIWIVGSTGIAAVLIVGAWVLMNEVVAGLMTAWILAFKALSIFVVLKFVQNINKHNTTAVNTLDAQPSIAVISSHSVYVLPQQQIPRVDIKSKYSKQENCAQPIVEVPPPSYTELHLETGET
ncbi:hypothetical protein Ocin01_16742 [Orchesella cincta]|uniref:Uncharacterized protein n=1 Tax=Orchesella cincta TaxID=48709 RepID=A0A1D2MAH7_ORCCI|nr:hypothetical protein Ocin01_16742 [Orchesella cincta]